MKILFRILLVLSIVLFAFVAWSLLNTYVSFKYEIDEPGPKNFIGQDLKITAKYIKELITCLWISLGYLFVIILVCIAELLNRK